MAAPRAGRAIRLLQVAGLNAIPLGGVLVGQWALSTAIATYWFETLVGTAFVIMRLVLHRHLTRKKGYWYAPLQDDTPRARRAPSRRYVPVRQNYVERFVITMSVFTLAHGLILTLLLVVALPQRPEWPVLAYAALGVLGFQAIGLAADLVGLRDRPFAWAQTLTGHYLARVVLVHLSIIAGAFTAVYLERPASFLAAFGVLKLVADLAAWFPQRAAAVPATPPRWLAAMLAKAEPDRDPSATWAALVAVDREKRALWEEQMPRP